MIGGPSDSIIVKVTLKTGDQTNNSSIKNDWNRLLAEWAKANDCEVASISWRRLRTRFVHDPNKATDDIYCDVIQESKDEPRSSGKPGPTPADDSVINAINEAIEGAK